MSDETKSETDPWKAVTKAANRVEALKAKLADAEHNLKAAKLRAVKQVEEVNP